MSITRNLGTGSPYPPYRRQYSKRTINPPVIEIRISWAPLILHRKSEHDFPQQITYRREGDRLHAEIEGITDGEKLKTGWVFDLMP